MYRLGSLWWTLTTETDYNRGEAPDHRHYNRGEVPTGQLIQIVGEGGGAVCHHSLNVSRVQVFLQPDSKGIISNHWQI